MYFSSKAKVSWLLTSMGVMLAPSSAFALSLNEQRNLYDQVQEALDKKDLAFYQSSINQLTGYPLAPYLDYRAFLVDLQNKSPRQATQFEDNHKAYPFSAWLSAEYLDAKFETQKWQDILDYKATEPKGQKYQCIYYTAKWKVGELEGAWKGAEKLYLNGHSVDDSCDDLFAAWKKAGLQTDALILERMLLAFDKRNLSLMKYLSKKLNSPHSKRQAQHVIELYQKPERVVRFVQQNSMSEFNQELVASAAKKWGRSQPDVVQSQIDFVAKRANWDSNTRQKVFDSIGWRLMNTDEMAAKKWRDSAIKSSSSTRLIERRIRLAIQEQDWSNVESWIHILPNETQQSMRWQYWLGRAEVEQGIVTNGMKRLEQLLGQRNFYSVAAATSLQQSYDFSYMWLDYDFQTIAKFTSDLERIDELIVRDKIGAAKLEWRWLLSRASVNQRKMLAGYAAKQRWHHLTVEASIQARAWDHLEIRFPVAHQWWFNFYGDKLDIDPLTLMSVARQESAFDSQARSGAGAKGIMQILPSTAKYTARKYKLSYQGSSDLFEVGKNIEIGSRYLKSLLSRYNNNRIFAFAAYNAGPHRVSVWRERSAETLDVFSFIETIPFTETRGYVQNILMFESYYRDLLEVDGVFLKSHELNAKY